MNGYVDFSDKNTIYANHIDTQQFREAHNAGVGHGDGRAGVLVRLSNCLALNTFRASVKTACSAISHFLSSCVDVWLLSELLRIVRHTRMRKQEHR